MAVIPHALTGEFVRRLANILPFVERLKRNKITPKGKKGGGGSSRIRRFELKDDLSKGGKATAHPLKYTTADGYTADLTESKEFQVADGINTFFGDGRNTTVGQEADGSRGYCVRMNDRLDAFEILQMDC